MFELSLSTTLLILGFPLFWVLYTVIFLLVSRKWDQTTKRPEDAS